MGSIYRDGNDYTYGRIDQLWEGFLMELAIIWVSFVGSGFNFK